MNHTLLHEQTNNLTPAYVLIFINSVGHVEIPIDDIVINRINSIIMMTNGILFREIWKYIVPNLSDFIIKQAA